MSSWISEHEHQAKKVYEEEIAELTTAMNQLKTNLDVLIRNEKSVVSKIQTVLKEQEYYWSSVDGLFGTGTVSAVKTFFSDPLKYFKFSLSNKILQVHVYVLWYKSKDFFKWILINSKLD